MNTYDKVKLLLQTYPKLRNSDKLLSWKFWQNESYEFHSMTLEMYMSCTSFESISRARRKVQEHHKELRATSEIEEQRQIKEATQGLFIFK